MSNENENTEATGTEFDVEKQMVAIAESAEAGDYDKVEELINEVPEASMEADTRADLLKANAEAKANAETEEKKPAAKKKEKPTEKKPNVPKGDKSIRPPKKEKEISIESVIEDYQKLYDKMTKFESQQRNNKRPYRHILLTRNRINRDLGAFKRNSR